jgi:hypothetical protein
MNWLKIENRECDGKQWEGRGWESKKNLISKGNTFMIISKKFQQKICFICMIYPVYGKEKLNWPRWSQFLFLKHIFLFSFLFQFLVKAAQNQILFRFSSPPFPLFTITFTIFYFQSIHFQNLTYSSKGKYVSKIKTVII